LEFRSRQTTFDYCDPVDRVVAPMPKVGAEPCRHDTERFFRVHHRQTDGHRKWIPIPGEPVSMTGYDTHVAFWRRVFIVTLMLLLFAYPATAVYSFNGVALHTVAHGKHHGTVSVSGGHGLTATPYAQSFTVPAGTVRVARLYVGVWGGTPEYKGTLDVSLNGASLGSRPMNGGSDTGNQVYVSGYGVHWSVYDVTGTVKPGSNTASATTAGEQFDGRVYGMLLAVATEDTSAPEIEYWFAEGNENLNKEKGKTSVNLALGTGPKPESVTGARLYVAYVASTRGDDDQLLFNGQSIATDAAGASSGGYYDVRSYDVTSLRRDSATIGFSLGNANRLHPAFIGYVATLADAPTATPSTAPTTVATTTSSSTTATTTRGTTDATITTQSATVITTGVSTTAGSRAVVVAAPTATDLPTLNASAAGPSGLESDPGSAREGSMSGSSQDPGLGGMDALGVVIGIMVFALIVGAGIIVFSVITGVGLRFYHTLGRAGERRAERSSANREKWTHPSAQANRSFARGERYDEK
jgi:hypothetical protein